MTENPTKSTVYVDVEDDITAIIDKVGSAKQAVVALVLPKRSAVLQSTVNMRLLKRSADKHDKKVVLITSDQALMPLAGAAGLHVAKNLHSAPEIPAGPGEVKTGGKLAAVEAPVKAPHEDADAPEHEMETIDLADKAEAAEPTPKTPPVPLKKGHKSAIKIPNFDSFRNRLGLLIGGFIALILLFIIAGKVLPKATITIKASATPVSADVDLTTSDTADKLDLKKGIIPADLKTTDQSSTQQVTATGSKNLGKKASGNVSLKAEDCSAPFATPSSVPAGSGVSTGGHVYITQTDTNFGISGASGSCVEYSATKSTDIKAQQGGSDYNVDSGDFTVAGRSDVTGSGSASGGTDNKVTVLSQDDVDNAVKGATGDDNKSLTDKFKKNLDQDGFYVIESTLKAGKAKVTASPAVGQQASTSSLSIKVTYSALVVKKDDLDKAIRSALEKEIDKSNQKLGSEDLLKNISVEIQSQSNPTTASLSVSEHTTAVPQLDTVAIAKQVGGQEEGAIREEVGKITGVEDVSVSFSPFWVSSAPKKPSKVHVIVQEVTTSQKSAP